MHSSYVSAQRKFYNFCLQLGKIRTFGSPCVVNEWNLGLFPTFLVQHSTIKVYLTVVHSLRINLGFPDPLVD